MRHTWRWFRPVDRVSVQDAAQAGAHGIVSALHHIPTGDVWPVEEIGKRQEEVRAGGLEWEVVESVPVSESIRPDRSLARAHRQLAGNAAPSFIRRHPHGLLTISCRSSDWTLTDLRWDRAPRAKAMRFDRIDLRGLRTLHLLERPGAYEDYDAPTVEAAEGGFVK